MNDPSIFSGTGDWRLNAGVNYPNDAHMLMTEGCLRAAQRLILSLEDSRTGVDFLVYPIVFLYRHWFELRLKDIIIQGRRLVQEEGKYPTGHKLHYLWPRARAIIEKVWSESDRPSEFDLIDAAVAEFEKFDSNSQSFRYPIASDGKFPLAELAQINLDNFSNGMEQIAGFLDGAADGIRDYLDSMPFDA